MQKFSVIVSANLRPLLYLCLPVFSWWKIVLYSIIPKQMWEVLHLMIFYLQSSLSLLKFALANNFTKHKTLELKIRFSITIVVPFGVFSPLSASFHFCLAGPDREGTVPVLLSLLYELGGREHLFLNVVWARPTIKKLKREIAFKISNSK